MVITKITVCVVFLSLAMVAHALRCYVTGPSTTKGDLGTIEDCDNNKWCAKGYDDAGEYIRGCGMYDYGYDDEAMCDLVGNTCQSPPPGPQPWPKGATLCCCQTDLCNGNKASSYTCSTIMAIVALFSLVILTFN
uniref:Uncharacterized protein n=1 Tax=Plectus sambesii TaxID=2011161 RepID=A0A914W9Z6_9BILA